MHLVLFLVMITRTHIVSHPTLPSNPRQIVGSFMMNVVCFKNKTDVFNSACGSSNSVVFLVVSIIGAILYLVFAGLFVSTVYARSPLSDYATARPSGRATLVLLMCKAALAIVFPILGQFTTVSADGAQFGLMFFALVVSLVLTVSHTMVRTYSSVCPV